ncbi:alpha/beta fold hydrolase [Patulibacter sp.]|uniref:alpha/beta fold hydrolase n=1 Tax=Patulibacter sp. TaxID=1912859 RepID=UPI00271E3FA8|nr:alpha/beta hydrolase [Patulibacter sp.]MDO9407333.1 alpha/beta hydrolase [Patulibacter sp.]
MSSTQTAPTLPFKRGGSGSPLLMIHGLGGNRDSFDPILPALQAEHDVISPDLPGHGEAPELAGAVTVDAIADRLEAFLDAHDLDGVDVVGSSLGARLVLELARRGRVGTAIALDPGGFWSTRQRSLFGVSVAASFKLVVGLQKALPTLTGNPVTRTALLAQFSARPWALPQELVAKELRQFAASPGFTDTLDALWHGPLQAGLPAGQARGPIHLVWGRQDRVTFASQAPRAQAAFPDADLTWIEKCGHFPHWDQPDETTRLVLGWTRS